MLKKLINAYGKVRCAKNVPKLGFLLKAKPTLFRLVREEALCYHHIFTYNHLGGLIASLYGEYSIFKI